MIAEEEVIYVNDGLKMSRDHAVLFCEKEEYEYRMVEPPMANPKKDLAKMIDASENLPHHYKECLALGGIVNSLISKIIFILYLDLSPRMWMSILSITTNHP